MDDTAVFDTLAQEQSKQIASTNKFMENNYTLNVSNGKTSVYIANFVSITKRIHTYRCFLR